MRDPGERGAGRSPPGGHGVGVLTVDDQATFRSAAQLVIEATPGFECVGEARSGQEALALVDGAEPDLILLDVRMPEMDGIETTRRLKAAHPGVVVVLITVDENVPAPASTSGAAALVRKQDFGSSALRALWSEHGGQG